MKINPKPKSIYAKKLHIEMHKAKVLPCDYIHKGIPWYCKTCEMKYKKINEIK